MDARTTFRAALEIVLWWAGLTVLWIVLISSVDTLEWAVGASAALVGAVAARAARRAVGAR
ncbi:hypothetical protein [Streptomyces sp. Ru72]|uniref:hypothetical protein n=1 Tax=Streptomyces sp. Ru72 TaxID=2080747 RepID=UPI000CDD736A|nr:hypothetical protein [Streptomyces sp. Ru72]POX46180.1 hypothetical protein C3488_27285 [Streptomyces sp. Ru72]